MNIFGLKDFFLFITSKNLNWVVGSKNKEKSKSFRLRFGLDLYN